MIKLIGDKSKKNNKISAKLISGAPNNVNNTTKMLSKLIFLSNNPEYKSET